MTQFTSGYTRKWLCQKPLQSSPFEWGEEDLGIFGFPCLQQQGGNPTISISSHVDIERLAYAKDDRLSGGCMWGFRRTESEP